MRCLGRSSPTSADVCGRTAASRDLWRNDPRHLVEILRRLRADDIDITPRRLVESKSFVDCGRTASPGVGAVGAWIIRETFARLPYP